MSRREMLAATGTALVACGGAVAWHHWARNEHGLRAEVAVLKADNYDVDLAGVIRDGLRAIGIAPAELKGKRILLKPNLVETALGQAHINTNPAMVAAAAEAFLQFGAKAIVVAEGQGHRRDSTLVLDESGMGYALRQDRLRFVDLNHDDIVAVPNRGHEMLLDTFHLPKTLVEADLVVSMPKLKTHHWAGVTCGMKNLFGVMPGIVYGWPKNVLHYHGIAQSIFDINSTVRPQLTIADGIIGMEGDGPIMGTPKHLGCIIVGRNTTAVDATAVRLMGLNPYGVEYITKASGKLGPIHEKNITQRGEAISDLRQRFTILDRPHLKNVASA